MLVPWNTVSQLKNMFRAIGVVIILWYVSSLFASSFAAADRAFSATFRALEVAAIASEKQFAQ